jgi:Holliday junction resolvasome RuvABC ATP-dependent DNA helicase subunit
MRAAVLQLPGARTANENRQVLRAAIRQLERADVYLAAVQAMEIDDRGAHRALRQLRADIEGLRRHLAELRSRT